MMCTFRRAEREDLESVMRLMREAKDSVPDTSWFEADGMETVTRHLEEEGFILLAECKAQDRDEGEETAAFLIVRFPGSADDNLGEYLHLEGEDMAKVAHLETAVVSEKFRGMHLQYRLFKKAEEMLNGSEYKYLMATVHPDNVYSLRNMEELGCEKAAEVLKYGGKRRLVMCKKL